MRGLSVYKFVQSNKGDSIIFIGLELNEIFNRSPTHQQDLYLYS